MNLLKLEAHLKWGDDRTTHLKLHMSLIKSKVDYGCEAYSSACQTYLNSLQPIQNSALRISLGAFKSSPVLFTSCRKWTKAIRRI